MASHSSNPVELTHVAPESLVKMNANELIALWEDKLGLNIWMELGQAYLDLKKNSKISQQDKFDAAVKMAELGMKSMKAGEAGKKGGSVSINIVTKDPTKR